MNNELQILNILRFALELEGELGWGECYDGLGWSFNALKCWWVGEGVAFGGVAGPAGGGVDVEGDEEDVGGALGCADGVGAEDAFFEGDVFGFGDEELGVVSFGLEGCEDLVGEVAGVGVFEEGAVWGAFAGGVVAVGGV